MDDPITCLLRNWRQEVTCPVVVALLYSVLTFSLIVRSKLGSSIGESDDSEKEVNAFDEKRKEQPQDKIDEFVNPIQDYVNGLKQKDPQADNTAFTEANKRLEKLKNDMIDVKSEYFYLTAQSQIGDTVIMLISLMHRKDGKVKTLRRGLGVI